MAADSSQTVEILVKLRDEISRGMKKVNTQLTITQRLTKTVSKSLSVFRGALAAVTSTVFSLGGAIAALGVGVLSRSFLKAASTAEQYQIRLNALLGSVKQGNLLFKEMSTFAGTVSFQYEEIMGSATALAGVMKGGNKEIGEWMPLIADLASVSGLGIQETTSQVIRMYSAGAAAADLFRERGILSMLGFQAGVSTSAEKTRKKLMEAWKDPDSQFKDASQKLASTWQGMMSMMSDAWFQFRTMVMDAGVFNFMKGALSLVLDKIKELRDNGDLQKWADNTAAAILAMVRKIGNAVSVVTDIWRGWRLIWASLTLGFAHFAKGINTGLSFIMDTLSSYLSSIQMSIKAVSSLAARMSKFDLTGLSAALAENLDETSGTLEDIVKYSKDFGDNTENNATFWDGIIQDSQKVVVELSKQTSSLSTIDKLLNSIQKRADEYAEAARKAALVDKEKAAKPIPMASFEAQLQSATGRFLQLSQTALANLDDYYQKGIHSFASYFDERQVILEANFQKEMSMLRQLEALQTDPTKKLKIQDQIFAKEQAHNRAILALAKERDAAEIAEGEKSVTRAGILNDIKLRVAREGLVQNGTVIHEAEMDAMAQRHADEIAQLRDLKASEAEIEAAHRKQQIELDKKAAKMRMQVLEGILSASRDMLSVLGDYYKQQYENSGKENTKAAKKYKRVMIAMAIIDTMSSAIKAYLSLASIPYVGAVLGAAAAAAAVAAGYQRVNQIKNQQLAEGGLVEGHSPHSKADNIPINATAGEFMHPVDTVKYYGRKGMEIIKNKLVPRDTLYNMAKGVSLPVAAPPSMRYAYATGGGVGEGAGKTPGSDSSESANGKQPINITNIIDPQMMGQYTSSKPGQRNIMNVLSENQFQLKQIVLGE